MKVQSIVLTTLALTLPLLQACKEETTTGSAATETAGAAKAETVGSTTAATQPQPGDDSNVIATVNDTQITEQDFEQYLEMKMASNPVNVGDPAMVLNEMINKELLLQAATASGIAERPDIAKQITESKNNILINSLINDKVSSIDNSDEALKAEYDAQVKSINLKEYKARHILVNDEDTAKAIITELEGGKDFATLAKEKSTGPSGANGGDLGWFQAQTMVPEFSAALETMEKGNISKEPVKTQFGWHVILFEDIRDMEVPSFEESKAQIKSILANKTVQDYMTSLRDNAKIDIKLPEQPAAAAPAEAAPAEAPATEAPASESKQ
jgi:peptidyl-prolyl cis-trans isomerase C